MLSDPGSTSYDLNFRLFGYPVQVHPLFFLMPVFLGGSLSSAFPNLFVGIFLLTILYFVSILVHEFGHALAFRRYGLHSRIVLYMMGGLAIPERNLWGSQRGGLNANQKIFVSFAGPLAGFLLAGVCVLVGLAMGGELRLAPFIIPFPSINFAATPFANNASVNLMINYGIALNIFLNLLNLLPVYPLDGGQISWELFGKYDYRNGHSSALYLSIGVAVLIAIYGLRSGTTFLAFLFGMLAFNNYQMLSSRSGPRW